MKNGRSKSSARRLKKLLVANRGEIAIRIIRAARELGIRTVAAHGTQDRGALHVEAADEHRLIRSSSPAEAYLHADLLVEAALECGADAVHPGYGFLAENALFARACEEAGLVFVGPPSKVLQRCGDKVEARELARRAGVPVIPGDEGDAASLPRAAERLGYPVLIKAAAGGGGRGIRRVDRPEDLTRLLEQAAREASGAFGDGRLFLERWIPRARHVEFQVVADGAGNVVELGERDCSLQRRHQKIVEETPSPALDEDWRRRMGEAAVKIAKEAGYRGAGTMEFLLEVDPQQRPVGFFFLEVNARIQVEHPITEATCGEDLVGWQLRIASGEALPAGLASARSGGHAIECRISAESHPSFLPSTGTILVFHPPSGPGIRFDTGYREGDEITEAFDSLVAKVIAWAPNRQGALRRMELALESTVILGVETNTDFLADIVRHPEFQKGRYTTLFLSEEMASWRHEPPPEEVRAIAAAAARRGDAPAGRNEARALPGPWERLNSIGHGGAGTVP